MAKAPGKFESIEDTAAGTSAQCIAAGRGRGAAPRNIALAGLFACAFPAGASAQSLTNLPQFTANPQSQSVFDSAASGAFDLGSTFLNRLGNQATYGFNAAARINPGGGGAPDSNEAPPRLRSWFETYAMRSRQDADGLFVGDRRRTVGGIAGASGNLGRGVMLGASVDHSRTKIDVPLAAQSATLDMTQLGVNLAYENGPWTAALAVVRGFGAINSERLDGATFAIGKYDARLTGVLGEVSYYQGFGQSRIVPKAALEWLGIETDAFTEAGGTLPVSVSGQSATRTRLYLGAEVGHYWIVNQLILDLSGYGKFVDNIQQDTGSVNVAFANGTGTPISVQGLSESRYGFNTGATLSLSFTQTARAYLSYDGKYRDGFQSHTGTAGLDVRW